MPDSFTPDPNLRIAIDRIVAAYDPERIYLFGSRARGEEHGWSDYDLLAVIPDETPKFKLHPVWVSEHILDVPFPLDFFPCRVSVFQRSRHGVGNLSAVAEDEGRVVYERR